MIFLKTQGKSVSLDIIISLEIGMCVEKNLVLPKEMTSLYPWLLRGNACHS